MAVKPYEERKYAQSQQVTDYQNQLAQMQQQQPQQYNNRYQGQMEGLMNQYQNRGPFAYDINTDALYQQAAQRYMQQGQQAMMDTMGQAAMLTGGYGNSAAQIAGQQQYQGYLQALMDQAPQYMQMARDNYDREGQDLLNQYNLMADAENREYSRYQNDLNLYYQNLDRAQQNYNNERDYDYSRYLNDRNFDYGTWQDAYNQDYQQQRDAENDRRYNQEWEYQQQQDALANSRYDQKLAQSQVDYMLSIGADIPEELLKLSGYDPAYIAAIKQQRMAAGSGGGGGASSAMTLEEAKSLAAQAGKQLGPRSGDQIKDALIAAGATEEIAKKATAVMRANEASLQSLNGKPVNASTANKLKIDFSRLFK